MNTHVELNLASGGSKSFDIIIDKPMQIGLYAQHTAEEFNIQLIKRAKMQLFQLLLKEPGLLSMNMMMRLVLSR